MEQPVEYVGGLSDAKRPRTWPYLALAGGLVMVLVGGLVFRGSILASGRAFGESFVPYSLNLTAAGWSSSDKLTGVPLTLTLQVQNADPRTVQGLTIRLVNLSSQLAIVSAKPEADITGSSFFFPQPLPPSKAETLAITLNPRRAGDWRFSVTITPAHGTTPARVLNAADGTVTTSLAIGASVRDPTAADASAQVGQTWNPQVAVGGTTVWKIQLTNDGPIAISSVTLGFQQAPAGFEIVGANPQASQLADGRLRFVMSLGPGSQGTVSLVVVAHAAGQFQVPISVYLDDAADPIVSTAGGPIVNLNIVVS